MCPNSPPPHKNKLGKNDILQKPPESLQHILHFLPFVKIGLFHTIHKILTIQDWDVIEPILETRKIGGSPDKRENNIIFWPCPPPPIPPYLPCIEILCATVLPTIFQNEIQCLFKVLSQFLAIFQGPPPP